jgi:hypothetical protein
MKKTGKRNQRGKTRNYKEKSGKLKEKLIRMKFGLQKERRTDKYKKVNLEDKKEKSESQNGRTRGERRKRSQDCKRQNAEKKDGKPKNCKRKNSKGEDEKLRIAKGRTQRKEIINTELREDNPRRQEGKPRIEKK